jgi:hypothetical protein
METRLLVVVAGIVDNKCCYPLRVYRTLCETWIECFSSIKTGRHTKYNEEPNNGLSTSTIAILNTRKLNLYLTTEWAVGICTSGCRDGNELTVAESKNKKKILSRIL